MSARVDFAYLRAVRSTRGPSTSDARLVAIILGIHADRGSCFLDRVAIADETLLGRRRVRSACALLVAEGWATEEHLPGQPRWVLHLPSDAPSKVETGQAGCSNRSGCKVETGQAEPPSAAETGQAARSKPVKLGAQTGQATPPRSTPKKTTAETTSDPAVDDPILVGVLGGSEPRPSVKVFEPILRTVDPPSPKVIAAEPKAQNPARAPAKRRRPDAWAPTAKHFAKGLRLGFGDQRVNTEAEKFAEHHDARGNLFVDWDAAFSGWLGKAREIDDARGVPREAPDDPLFRAPGEPWVKPPEPPPQRTPEEQAAVDAAFARYKIAREASIRQHSRSEHRRIAEAEREAELAAETDPERLKLIEITKRRRAELAAQESLRRGGSEMN